LRRWRWIHGAAPALLCILTAAGSHAQDAAADARLAVESCIRDNAPRVEQAFESLTEAVTFLLGSVCAKPVADAAQIAAEAERESQRARLEEYCAGTENADPFDAAASRRAETCSSRELMDIYGNRDVISYATMVRLGGASADAEAVSLASSLLLDARLARLATAGE
jgi:hypothetical protein